MTRLFPNTGTFRSLANYNYRLWAGGAIVSNVGTWMQRVAQDWLVLTQLTHNNASAVGVVMALQFGPQMLLLPLTRLCRRSLRPAQAPDGHAGRDGPLRPRRSACSPSPAWSQLWHVYVFAFLLGCAAAFDAPARQTFVSDLVGEADLPNAVALNSTSFNAARMVGPALAGLLIAAVGNGLGLPDRTRCRSAPCSARSCSCASATASEPHGPCARRAAWSTGFRYVWSRPDLKAMLLMLFLIGTFGMNFPIFISTMAVTVFHAGAGEFGLLTSMMAIGTVTGALLAARPREAAHRAPAHRRRRLRRSAARWRRSCRTTGCSAARSSSSACPRTPSPTDQQPDAAVDRARHARPRDGDLPGHRAGRHADRRADRRLGRRQVRPALGARRRRCGGLSAAIVMIHYLVKRRRLRLHVAGGRLRFTMDKGEAFYVPR